MKPEDLYYKMQLIRKAEEAIIAEYPKNEIKTPSHLCIGAEAIAVGICATFPNAKIFGSYRNHHWYLATGGSLEDFFLELYGKENRIADGKAGSMHLNSPETGLMLTSAIVSSQIAPAIGHAFAQSYKRTNELTIVALGDGATEEGVFYESLNLASLYGLKILFVLEDNDLAIHQDKETRQNFHLIDLMRAYRMEYYRSDAYCLDRVLEASQRLTQFPALISLNYHRFLEHVGPSEDYNAGYREKPRNLDRMDPIKLLPCQEVVKGLSFSQRERLEEKAKFDVNHAIKVAKAGKCAPKEALLYHVYAN